MAETENWEWSEADRGYGEVRLDSWKYFVDFAYDEMLNYETYIWRGQRCDSWDLESTFDRLVKAGKVDPAQRWDFRSRHLEQFKFAVRGRRGANPPQLESENDWWALGQHHGLATPLLDWTLSPFVAAYFAFIGEGGDQTEYRAIFALHKPSVEERVKKKQRTEETKQKEKKEAYERGEKPANILVLGLLSSPIRPEVEFIRPFSDENQRLVNQGGLFSRAPQDKSIKEWVQENGGEDDDGYTLIKVLVPNKDREECLKNLNRMNINHLTLFPDLYGASKFCNLFSEIEQY